MCVCVCVCVQLVQALRYETPEFLDPQLEEDEEEEEEDDDGGEGKSGGEEENKKDLSLEATYSEGEYMYTSDFRLQTLAHHIMYFTQVFVNYNKCFCIPHHYSLCKAVTGQ